MSAGKLAPPTSGKATATLTAAYISDISGQLRRMARDADLAFLSHLLAMAQAEAEHIAELGE